jgi:hypothetical protein
MKRNMLRLVGAMPRKVMDWILHSFATALWRKRKEIEKKVGGDNCVWLWAPDLRRRPARLDSGSNQVRIRFDSVWINMLPHVIAESTDGFKGHVSELWHACFMYSSRRVARVALRAPHSQLHFAENLCMRSKINFGVVSAWLEQ